MHFKPCLRTILKVASVCVVLAGVAEAYPEYYVQGGFANGCTSHPTQAYGGHKNPVQDRNIVFQLSDSAAAGATTSVCPGVKYSLTVSYVASSRRTLLTVSEGKFAAANDPSCPNRAYSVDGAADTFTQSFTLPCDVKAKRIDVKVTSAQGSGDNFHYATSTLTVKPLTQCPGSTCPGAPAAAAAATAKPAAAAAAVPAAAAAKPEPEAEPAGDNKTATALAAAAATPAAATAKNAQQPGSSCGESSYGYACKVNLQQGASLHFTKGGAVPPSNPCTSTISSSTQMVATAGSNAEPVHFLLEAPLNGYAGLSFPVRKGQMYPADAVIGYADSATAQPRVSAYALTTYSPTPSATNSNGLGWASNLGTAAATGSNGRSGTLLCFSRMSDAPSAQFVKALNLEGVDMNWVNHKSEQFEQHQLTGQVTVNMNSGAASGASASVGDERRMRAVLAHGALMLLAFIFFFPLGALMARHKWLAGDKVNGGIRASWFHGHRATQLLALLLSLAGLILALVVFDVSWRMGDLTPHRLYDLHRILGLVVISFVVIQAIAGLARPKLTSSFRQVWRFGHLSLGWLTTALGIVVAFVGIVIMHDLRQQPWINWLLPAVLLLGLLLAAGTVLEVLKYKVQRSGRYHPTMHYFSKAAEGKPSSSSKESITPLAKNTAGSPTRLHNVNASSSDIV